MSRGVLAEGGLRALLAESEHRKAVLRTPWLLRAFRFASSRPIRLQTLRKRVESARLSSAVFVLVSLCVARMDQAAQTAAADDVHKYEEPTAGIDAKTERRLLWKVDLILIPLLTISYGLQFLDKAVLGSASVFGIIPDLGLSTTVNGVTSTVRYSTANSAFYWGYIVGVLPLALVLQRVPIAKTLAVLIFLWGLIALLTIFVTSYQGLVVQRVFLGLVESAVSPGFVIVSSRWYKKSELALRIGLWYSATGLFSMFSGVVFFGIGHANGPLATWKCMYIFCGSWTMLHGIIVFFLLPDSIAKSGLWFSQEERDTLQQRMRQDAHGSGDTRFHRDQLAEAVLDIRLYLFLLMGAAIYIINGSVTAFGARIISTFGYSSIQAIALQIPGGFATCVSIYLAGWICGRWKNITTYMLALWCLPTLIGSIILWKASWAEPHGWPVFGYTLLPFFGAPYVLLLALNAQNIGGGTKKAVSAAFVFLGYNAGNIAAPYLVFTPEAPEHYKSTWISNIVVMCFTFVAAFVLRFILIGMNKQKDQQQAAALQRLRDEAPESVRSSLDDKSDRDDSSLHLYAADLSDKRNPYFRYSL